MENRVGRASPIWLNHFRPTIHRSIQIILIPTPLHEITKAIPQNGFIFIFIMDKNKIYLKTQSSYLTSSAG